MNPTSRTAIASLALIMLASVGCQRSYTANHELKPAGFLSSYDGLEPNKHGNYQYKSDSLKLTDYHAFIIEPVALKLPNGGAASADERARAQRYMQAAITNAVGAHYPVVDSAGPGVARWRTAITGLRASGASNGGAAAEVEVVDSVSGQRIIAVVADEDARGEHANNPTPWHDARAVMDAWAGRIRAAFDKAHGLSHSLTPAR